MSVFDLTETLESEDGRVGHGLRHSPRNDRACRSPVPVMRAIGLNQRNGTDATARTTSITPSPLSIPISHASVR